MPNNINQELSSAINQDLASSKENKNFNTPLFSTTKQEKTPSPFGPGYCTTSFNKEENEILNEIEEQMQKIIQENNMSIPFQPYIK